jgi:hypothetical protein
MQFHMWEEILPEEFIIKHKQKVDVKAQGDKFICDVDGDGARREKSEINDKICRRLAES